MAKIEKIRIFEPKIFGKAQNPISLPKVYVSPKSAANNELKWAVSDPEILTVNGNLGVGYCHKKGDVTVVVSDKDEKISASFDVDIYESTYVQSITINPQKLILAKNTNYTLDATVEFDDNVKEEDKNRGVEWYSDNYEVASVDRFLGTVYAKKPGIANICAVAADLGGAIGYCRVECVETYAHKGYTTMGEEDTGINKTDEYKEADPVDVFSGAHLLENTLMKFFDGQKLCFNIKYDSSRLAEGIFGKGWYCDYEKHIVPPTDINTATEILVNTSPSVYSVFKNDYSSTYYCDTPNKRSWFLQVGGEDYMYNLCCGYDSNEYYNNSGKLVKIVNRDGFVTTVAYGDNLITITDTLSNQNLYLEKDESGKVTRVYDDNEREAILTYTNGIITEIKDPNDNIITYTYNSEGQVMTGTDGNQVCFFSNTYDSLGRVIKQLDGAEDPNLTEFIYDDDFTRTTINREKKKTVRVFDEKGLLLSCTDPNKNTTYYEYDDNNNVTKVIDANEKTIIKEYNTFNKPTKITDKCGNVTTMEYDSIGNLTKIIYPPVNGVNAEETFVYDTVGDAYKLVSHTDTRGTVTTYTYDPQTKMLSTKKVGTRNAIQYINQNGACYGMYDARGALIRYGRNALGLLSQDIEQGIEYEYDACGNLTKTTDALGNAVEITYDCNHQKTSVKDANGNITEYKYNGNMKKVQIKYPDGKTDEYEYDPEDRLIGIIDQIKRKTIFSYDDGGRKIATMLPDGALLEYRYDKVGNIEAEINPKLAIVNKTYDENGNVLSITDNDDKITRYEYDARNRPVKKTDAVGGITTYTYSVAGDLLSETDALGNTKTYTYDAFGNRLTETDARGNTTTYTYDANNNLTSVKDALNNTTTYVYDYLNRLTSITDAKNHTVSYGYDAAGRRNTITDARGNTFTTYYDGNGNVVKTTDAKGKTISETVFNSMNLPIQITEGTASTKSCIYNSAGEMKVQSNAEGNTQILSYNLRGMNTGVKDFANNNSTAEYDMLGNITKVNGPMGAETNYTYDEMGRITSQSTPSGGTVQYNYNAQNLKAQVINARGQTHQYTYDILGRITSITKPEGTTTYTYDANSNILTVTDANGTITRQYDALNRVTYCQTANGYNTWYEYDAVGNVSAITYYHLGKVSYTYDENNNLSTVTDWNGRVTSYTYDVNNNLIGITNANGTTTTKVYDDAQRLISSVDKKVDNTIICGYEYTYDNLGRISTEKNLANNKTMCYTYNSLSRLTKCEIKNASDVIISTQSFTYDAAGNIITAPTGTFAYDTNNKLITFNGASVDYDLDGNMLSMPVEDVPAEYTDGIYDSSNRLLRAMNCQYTYDAENNRIRNDSSYFAIDYVYNTNCRLSQVLATIVSGSPIFYIHGLGLIGEEESGQFYTYHYDYRGSMVAITNQSGNVVTTAEYDVYGSMTSCTGDRIILFGYNGRDGVQSDSNGFLYMRARYYCPQRRRFINADIIHGDISDSTSLNRYAYVNGNPVSFVDPFGLSAERGGGFWDEAKQFGKDFLNFGWNLIKSAHYIITGVEFKAGYGTGLRGSITLPRGLEASLGGKIDMVTFKLNRNELDVGQEAIIGAGIGIDGYDPLFIEIGKEYYISYISGKESDRDLFKSDGNFEIFGVELYIIQGFNASISYNYLETYELLCDVWS